MLGRVCAFGGILRNFLLGSLKIFYPTVSCSVILIEVYVIFCEVIVFTEG